MADQIDYLENLLKGLRARFQKGELDLDVQIRATAAKLAELKATEPKEDKTKRRMRFAANFRRRCCGA